ncbi:MULTISPECIES: hypothetical protein [Vibrio]|uniref:hypothetical protein n=1 Tax=Vibrio TaxID=662 RepID=UPI00078CABC9|nr:MULTISPECIES: hypothetical protein [Vibrio]BAU70881.1 hypothetical protein [Vibrio sp. 04Ya108]BBM67863.1 hypothetical protein VA249_45090 [Vibrio alfacsensis]BCN27032.1 hypothetical protein VYA_42240 [Vibrio alfacsensis]
MGMSRFAKCKFLLRVLVWATLCVAFIIDEPLTAVSFALYLMLVELLLITELDAQYTRMRNSLKEIKVILPKLRETNNHAKLKQFNDATDDFNSSYTKLFGGNKESSDDE